MRRIIKISFMHVLILFLVLSCKQDAPRYDLPDKIEHPKKAASSYITARALVDSLNRGARMNLFYLIEATPEDPDHIVDIPGMTHIPLGSIFQEVEYVNNDHPIYLICLYGDDSRRISGALANKGLVNYYLDGGSYRLFIEIERYGWNILPRPTVIE